MIHSQAKEAARKMKAAGFKRDEFSVRTERIYRAAYRRDGVKTPYDYGVANVHVMKKGLIEERLDAILAQGLSVTKLILESNNHVIWLISTEYKTAGKLVERRIPVSHNTTMGE